ncbi:MAG: asparagine synthase (glutamine-hydrolyzing) [Cyclobacteriaceae bacterium]
MCGILGIVNSTIELDLEKIRHRGPDDSGLYEDKGLKLGHTRLSIQDLSARGHQPFNSKDENFTIVFNGEIYNHWELRGELENLGYEFYSKSDTETVLLGYIEFGLEFIERLNGIFGFCIYDKEKGKLVVARDRFGVKPLYYFNIDDTFGFASELKALVDYVPSLTINEKAISNYLRYLWSPGEDTPVNEIRKLLPGRYIEVDLSAVGDSKITQYYKSGFATKYLSDSEDAIIEMLDRHLTNAVRRQLLSDVPVGYFLSGGLDSSLLVAIAKKINPEKKIQCFTIRTEMEHSSITDDLVYAQKIAKYLDVDLEIVDSHIEIVKDFDRMIYHLDEPQADAAPLNVLNISKRAREMGYKVLIGGTAGDDLFSGYRRHQALNVQGILDCLPGFIQNLLLKSVRKIGVSSPLKRRFKKIVASLAYPREDRVFSYFEWLANDDALDIFTTKHMQTLKENDPFDYFRKLWGEIPYEKSRLNKVLHLEMNSFLVDHNLNYTDKMGMACGVEIRVPYLDNDLVNFSYSIPPDLKMRGGETKYILKKVAEKYLPKEVIYRDKTGFGAPVRKWITNDLNGMIASRLSREQVCRRGIFNPYEIAKLIKNNHEQKIDASYSIWALLAIESWFQQFYDTTKVVQD